MFNLEQSISDWRQQMLAAGIQTPVPLEELETHLRDEVEHQIRSGLDVDKAFAAAAQKIGHAHLIQGEFQKVETVWSDRAWKIKQLVVMLVVGLFPIWIGSMALLKSVSFALSSSGERMSSLASLAVFSLLFWGGIFSRKLLPVIPSKRTRDVIIGSGFGLVMLWWVVFLRVIVPNYDFTIGQFGPLFLWAFCTPAGAIAGLALGLESAARKQNLLARS